MFVIIIWKNHKQKRTATKRNQNQARTNKQDTQTKQTNHLSLASPGLPCSKFTVFCPRDLVNTAKNSQAACFSTCVFEWLLVEDIRYDKHSKTYSKRITMTLSGLCSRCATHAYVAMKYQASVDDTCNHEDHCWGQCVRCLWRETAHTQTITLFYKIFWTPGPCNGVALFVPAWRFALEDMFCFENKNTFLGI